MRVYNFTGPQFALSNIALKRIKISRYRDLNDPFELLGVNLADSKQRNAFIKIKNEIDKKNGIICFSKGWKNPLLWGHYAEKHTGIVLGFDVPDEELLHMKYKKRLGVFEFDVYSSNKEAVVDNLLCTKFFDWKYEDEVRMVLALDCKASESGLYFEPFSERLQLREVILGPKCELPISKIRELVEGYSPQVEVIKSRIAFTKFKVLEHKAATRADRAL